MPNRDDQGPILVATDFSDAAEDAVREAAVRAKRRNVKLVALHVMPSAALLHPALPELSKEAVEAELGAQREARVRLARTIRDLTNLPAEQVESAVDFDEPYAGILRKAETIGAQLVVLGNRGHSGLIRLLLGSVAERVVRSAHCPVLVVRTHQPTGEMLIATDLSDPGMTAVARGANEAKKLGLHATVIHCVDIPGTLLASLSSLGPVPPVPDAETLEELQATASELLKAQLVRLGFEADITVCVSERADSEILRIAEERDVQLIVVGSHGRTGLSRLALGSTSESIVRHAHCNVLAVRLP